MRSNALRSTMRSLHEREARRAPRLDRHVVAVVELAHVQLARRGAALGTVRHAVDHHPARAADALAAVVVERDRLLAVEREPLVHDVEHLEERHVGVDAGHVVRLERAAARSGPVWRQAVSVMRMFSGTAVLYLYERVDGWAYSNSSGSLCSSGSAPTPLNSHAAT